MSTKHFIYSILFVLFIVLISCERKPVKKRGQSSTRYPNTERSLAATPDSKGKTVVKMKRKDGVYYIPCKINGVDMEFIFDTGASIISISAAEAIFLLKHDKLSEEDILGSSYFSDATGTISEGTLINLRIVKIGNRTLYNVRASVVHNLEAPLLLGQSALQQFGKVTIDYNNNQFIFE